MGNAPSAPTSAQKEELEREYAALVERAAAAIATADVLLFNTGAGWSADSGLAVYKDIADVPAYHERNVTYSDLCQPSWLTKEPELFFGFWGGCFNDYRNTAPHAGYAIVAGWRDAGIIATAIHPGFVATLMTNMVNRTNGSLMPLKRGMITAEESAAGIHRVCSRLTWAQHGQPLDWRGRKWQW